MCTCMFAQPRLGSAGLQLPGARRCPPTCLLFPPPSPTWPGSKLLREDEETPMTMFFGMMGGLIFCSVGPVLLLLW